MKITITGIHLNNQENLREYARKKAEKLAKYDPKIKSINVRLSAQKSHGGKNHNYYCEIETDLPGRKLEIVDHEETMDKAIDKATERMKKSLTRNKEKDISKKHRKGILGKLFNRFNP